MAIFFSRVSEDLSIVSGGSLNKLNIGPETISGPAFILNRLSIFWTAGTPKASSSTLASHQPGAASNGPIDKGADDPALVYLSSETKK
jgi:hypothetical protein